MISADRRGRQNSSWGAAALLVGLLLGGAALRLYNINWDLFRQLHPDERAIAMFAAPLSLPLPPNWANLLDAKTSTLNPHFFAYGSFTIYLLRLASWVAALFDPRLGSYEYLSPIGRVISALFDLGTIGLLYLLGSRLYGRAAGLLAAAFVTFTAFHIQLSHFYAADTLLTFALVLALVFAEQLRRCGRLRDAVGLGAAIGLAFAFKFSALPALLLPVVAAGLYIYWPRPGEQGWRRPASRQVNRSIGLVALCCLAAVVVGVVLQPYAVLDFATYVRSISEQNAMVRGLADLPYTRQYAGTTPYLYFLRNLVLWGYGPALGLTALAGITYLAVRQFVRPRATDLLLLAWVVPYFLVTGSFYAKFMRYLLPIMPALSLAGAVLVVDLYRWLAARQADGTNLWRARLLSPYGAVGLGGAALLGAVLYGAAFINVYSGEHPRLAASQWLYENVTAGSVITSEHWDDPLPLPMQIDGRQRSLDEYTLVEMPLYDDDTESKVAELIADLRRADFVILSSNRLYASIPRLPARYPVTTRYYQLLFGGQLGFALDKVFSNYPALDGWQIVDDAADESFTVYDHPKVLVFRKEAQLSESQLRSLLGPVSGVAPTSTSVRLMDPVQAAVEALGGTYAELFPADGWQNRLPLVAWVLALLGLGLVGLPFAVAALGWLPDRGYHFARPLALLLLTWLQWQVTSAGLLPATPGVLRLLLAALTAAAAGVAWWQRAALRSLWRERRAALLTGEAVFWGVFLIFLALRWLNPDLWHPARGGEKPMDFAYLMAVLKSEAYPPYDPWFAGGFLNYYYFGQLLVATLIKLTAIEPTIAYNLAVPFLAAATAAGVFSVSYSLAVQLLPGRERRRLASGLLAVGIVCFAGNLGGAGQLLDALGANGYHGLHSAIPGVDGLLAALTGLASSWLRGQPLASSTDWYWATTRVYPGASVNEFPFFTFLFADLHAHMIAMPYTLLSLAACLSLALSGEGLLPVEGVRARVWLQALLRWFVLALVLGALWPTNSWDFPTYLALAGFALFVVWFRGARSLARLLRLLVDLVMLSLTAWALYLPFHANFQSFYNGVDPAPERSPLHLYLVINGLFIFGLVSFLAYELWARHSRAGWWRGAAASARHWPRADAFRRHYGALVRRDDEPALLALYGLGGVVAGGLLLHLLGYTTLGVLLVLLSVSAWLALQPRRSAAETFLLGMIALGFGLSAFCELFAIKGDVGRMNTVFKFYLQMWIVWGVAGSVVLVALCSLAAKSRAWWSQIWQVGLALVLVAGLAYPVVATRSRLLDRFAQAAPHTLDGAAYLNSAVYNDEGRRLVLGNDYAAIQWLWQNVRGSPVVLEGWAPYYRWGARVAIYTGLPAVLGWDWHERQQRWGYQQEVERRVNEVNDAYSSTNPTTALAVIHEYGVSYVYVGELERAYYPAAGLAKFDALVGSTLDLVYDARGVKIYHVRGAA